MKTLLIIFLIPYLLFSQVNTEILRDLNDENKFIISTSFVSEFKSGNQDKFVYTNSLRIDYKKDKTYIFLSQFYNKET